LLSFSEKSGILLKESNTNPEKKMLKTGRKPIDDTVIELDLAGPLGNAWNLMAIAKEASKKLGLDPVGIIEEMRSKDYNHLLRVFEKYFGEYYTLYNVPEEATR
jgi:hypothetical protein